MKRLCGILVALAVVVVGIGFYRGWFVVTSGRESLSHKIDVNLTVDADKVQADADAVKDKAAELAGQAKNAVVKP